MVPEVYRPTLGDFSRKGLVVMEAEVEDLELVELAFSGFLDSEEVEQAELVFSGFLETEKESVSTVPTRVKLPDDRKSITHKFVIPGGLETFDEVKVGGRILYEKKVADFVGYVTVGIYDDGKPGEVFLTVGKAGDIWKAYDVSMVAISIALQHGVPVDVFAEKFTGMRYEPRGVTMSPDIPIAKSVADYLGRWLGMKFPKKETDDGNGGNSEGVTDSAE